MATNQQTAAALVAQRKDVRAIMQSQSFMDQVKMAIPEHASAQVIVRVATTTIQKTPLLLECSQESLLGAVIECAQLGLVPDGILGQAYLVPYNKKAQLQIGYRGLIELARRSGIVSYVVAEVVYECDEFEVLYAPERTIKHVPDFDNEARGTFDEKVSKFIPSGVRGAYALVKYKTGEIDFEYLPLHKIEQIRRKAQAGSKADAPWLNHWVEMARKTAIRALGKRLPLSAEFQKASNLDDLREQGIQHVEDRVSLSDTVMAEVAQSTVSSLAEKYAKPNVENPVASAEVPTDNKIIDAEVEEITASAAESTENPPQAPASDEAQPTLGAAFDPFASQDQPNGFEPRTRTRGSR